MDQTQFIENLERFCREHPDAVIVTRGLTGEGRALLDSMLQQWIEGEVSASRIAAEFGLHDKDVDA